MVDLNQEYSIPGVSVLLLGESGTGKTHSLQTLIEAGITPFVIFTEKGMSTLAKANIDPSKCHWHYISTATQDWGAMEQMAGNINKMSYDSLSKITDAKKGQYDQFMQVISQCHNFTCDRTGESFGDITTWGTDRAIVFDSLSGLNIMSMNLVIGAKPTKAMPDWMVAMDNLERFIAKITSDLQCHMVLTGHLELEKDEVSGGITLMASTLGRKLAPKLGRNFDEVLQCLNDSGQFRWASTGRNIALKTRYLEITDKLEPSFVPLIEAWKKAGGVIKPTVEKGDEAVK